VHHPHSVPDGYEAHSSAEFDFGIAYPAGWVARYDASTRSELFAPRDFSGEVHVRRPEQTSRPDTLESIAAAFRTEGVSDPVDATIDGAPALRFEIDVDDAPAILIVLVEDGETWSFELSTPLGDEDDVAQLEPVFEQMLTTFRRD
jgi:hypothetical protein